MLPMGEFLRIFGSYWKNYGGWGALLGSPFLWLATVAGILVTYRFLDGSWAELALQTVPAVLGFTLGGYAILVSFAASDFRHAIAGKEADEETSPLMDISAAFYHFFAVQTLAFVYAFISPVFYDFNILTDALQFEYNSIVILFSEIGTFIFTFIGCVLIIYTVLMILATAMRIYSLLEDYDDALTSANNNNETDE